MEVLPAIVRKTRRIICHRNEATVRRLMKKIEQTGSVNDVKTRVCLGFSIENIFQEEWLNYVSCPKSTQNSDCFRILPL